MRALERGLAVIKFFTGAEGPVTISAISRGTGFDRAVVRRILGTLEGVGYVSREGGGFVLTPSVLELGYAYLSSDPLPRIAEARLRPLAERVQESCSFGVMERMHVLYLTRVQIKRISGPSLIVGTMVQPYVTAIGRVLLASMDTEELDSYLASAELEPITPRTITSPEQLRGELAAVARQGWSLVQEELELGLLALAIPVHAPDGDVIGAINVTSHLSRTTREEFVEKLYPEIKATAEQIDTDLKNAYRYPV
ncbi:MAG TPA: IclR family transcriptional regulator C-terminal domain-containing protein [Trebonia sp.]|jgi:IclR family pca regulon transcriptional regulator